MITIFRHLLISATECHDINLSIGQPRCDAKIGSSADFTNIYILHKVEAHKQINSQLTPNICIPLNELVKLSRGADISNVRYNGCEKFILPAMLCFMLNLSMIQICLFSFSHSFSGLHPLHYQLCIFTINVVILI